MIDKTDLLRGLRIDRGEPPDAGARGTLRWWIAGILLSLVVGGAAVWRVMTRADRIPVTVVAAEAVPAAASRGDGDVGRTLLDASGYVVARRQATVSAKITGKIQQLFIEDGQHVAEGEVLAKLDDTNVTAVLLQAKAAAKQAEAGVIQARAAAEDIAPTYLRNQKQAEAGLISKEALEASKSAYDAQQTALIVAQATLAVQRAAVEVAQRNVDDTVVRAPYTGVITSKNAQPGEIISPLSAGGGFTRTGIGTLVDMDSLEVEVDVNENFISRVRVDEAASLTLNAYPDWQIPAYVVALVPAADRSKATVKVRIGFKTRDARILPEMGARVAFQNDKQLPENGTPAVGVLVPVSAVQRGAVDPTAPVGPGAVFVVHSDIVERRSVDLGARSQYGQIVLSGLQLGERLAIGDFSKLVDGARVIVNSP